MHLYRLISFIFVVSSDLVTRPKYVFNLSFDANRHDNFITHYFCVHQYNAVVKPTRYTFYKMFKIRHISA